MNVRRMLCILTAVLTVICSLPVSSLAAEDAVRMTAAYTPEYRLSVPDCSDTVKNLSAYADVDELKTVLLDAVAGARVVADIRQFNIPTSVHKELTELVFYDMPEAFNVYEIGYSYSGSELLTIHFGFRSFADTAEEYAVCFGKMKKTADKLLEGIENNSALSDVDKALLIHDRLCVHNEYPFYTDIYDVEHTAYGALANGSSVCQGYAMAYMYLLDRVGIKNYYASSDKINHAWNIVYIDNKPYHVDVTFDDINWETTDSDRNAAGALKHDNFLVSTSAFRDRNHNATDFDSAPKDTKYDNYYWRNSQTEFQLVGNKLYYIDNKNQKLMCVGEDIPLADVSDIWTAGGGAYWVGNFSRLSSEGAELLFSTAESIYKYTVTTGETKKIYSPYLHDKFSVYGFAYENGRLVYDVNIAPPGGDLTFLRRESSPYTVSAHMMYKIEAVHTGKYYIGDAFNEKNMTVTAYFTDYTNEAVSDGFEVTGFDSSKAGKNTLRVTYNGFECQLDVEVLTPSITLSADALTLAEKESEAVTAVTHPAGQTVSWKSSSQAVTAENGKITGIKAGTADVTAEFTYNGKAYSALCRVTVLCPHKNTSQHKELPPTVDKIGYTAGVFCDDCKKYISGHVEIPKLDLSFTPSDYMLSDGVNLRVIVGKLITELFMFAPRGCTVVDKNGKAVSDRSFAATGMVLVLPDNSRQEIVVAGDVDGDASLSAGDARLALRASVGLERYSSASAYFKAADIDKDKSVSAADARLILRASVGLEDNTLWL